MFQKQNAKRHSVDEIYVKNTTFGPVMEPVSEEHSSTPQKQTT